MRYADGHNEAVRARIVEAASRALRRDGIDAVSIPKLMKLVGLTHGGFYVHFEDRDDLVAAAVAHAAEESLARETSAREPFATYLSKAHLAHPELGCVIAALGIEGTRQKGRVRRAFGEAARELLRRVEARLHGKSPAGRPSDEAIAAATTIIGAVVLARLVQDESLSERILDVAKKHAGR